MKICPNCQKKYTSNSDYCISCLNIFKKTEKIDRINQIVGQQCWLCGYNKNSNALLFYHINSETRKFFLTENNIVTKKWKCILKEIKKCILVCPNCYKEIESGFVTKDHCVKVHRDNWGLNWS